MVDDWGMRNGERKNGKGGKKNEKRLKIKDREIINLDNRYNNLIDI